MSDSPIYIATVYGDGAALSTDASTMREAFDWVKRHVGGSGDEWTHGDVRLDGAKLVYFDPRETIWYGDGYARWESGR